MIAYFTVPSASQQRPFQAASPRAAAQGKNGLTLDSKDKSDTVSFAERALSKDCGENRFKQLVKIVGQEKAEETLKRAEAGFKENYNGPAIIIAYAHCIGRNRQRAALLCTVLRVQTRIL